MINGIVNTISKSGFQNLIQNTTAQVGIETGLKAVARPMFTFADKHADFETKKYSAAKEFLYQILCLGIYLAIIPPVFKRTGFKVFKSLCQKASNTPEVMQKISQNAKVQIRNCAVDMFKNEKGVLAVHELGTMELAERLNPNNAKAKKLIKTLQENLVESHPESKRVMINVMNVKKDGDYFKQFDVAKGGIEMFSILGSVIGLTVLAPEISHLVLHPIMHAVGLEKPNTKQGASEQKGLDAKA